MDPIPAVRLLIGSPTSANEFQDSDIQMFLDVNSGSLYLACALALESRASLLSANAQEVKIGDYSTSDRNRLASIQAQADKFRLIEFETPAFAIVEDNVSEFNALMIIRNYILRTEPTDGG